MPEPQGEYDFMGEVVLDITDTRFGKVVRSKARYDIERVSAARFIVRKGGSMYFVGLERRKGLLASCNCPDWRFHSRKMKVPCKHIWLVAEAEGLVTFPPVEMLPPEAEDNDVDREPDDEDRPTEEEEVEEIDIPID